MATVRLRPSRKLTIEGALLEVQRCLRSRVRVCLEIFSRGDRVTLYEYPPRGGRRQKTTVFGLTGLYLVKPRRAR
jgi:hypothetical protein